MPTHASTHPAPMPCTTATRLTAWRSPPTAGADPPAFLRGLWGPTNAASLALARQRLANEVHGGAARSVPRSSPNKHQRHEGITAGPPPAPTEPAPSYSPLCCTAPSNIAATTCSSLGVEVYT